MQLFIQEYTSVFFLLVMDQIFFFICFCLTSGSFFVIFSSLAPHRGQPTANCHPRWQPTRRLAVKCGLGRRRMRTWDCRTTVWHATIEPPCLPLSHQASHWATMPLWINTDIIDRYYLSCWLPIALIHRLKIFHFWPIVSIIGPPKFYFSNKIVPSA